MLTGVPDSSSSGFSNSSLTLSHFVPSQASAFSATDSVRMGSPVAHVADTLQGMQLHELDSMKHPISAPVPQQTQRGFAPSSAHSPIRASRLAQRGRKQSTSAMSVVPSGYLPEDDHLRF